MRSMRCLIRSVLLLVPLLAGCSGLKTFGTAARSGDTVVMALGWTLDLSRAEISHLTVRDAAGAEVVLSPEDAAIRSVFNAYPDPVSQLIVNAEKGGSSIMSSLIEGSVTAGDKEYSQTMVMLDLPQGLSPGEASITLTLRDGTSLGPVAVDVLPGAGSAARFENREHLNIGASHLRALERAPHYRVGFAGGTVPFGIQVDLVHDPDAENGGVGQPHVINPRGDIKNLSWRDDGTRMRVVLVPARDRAPEAFAHFKFYVAGGLAGLQVVAVRAFDIDGHPVSGVTAILE